MDNLLIERPSYIITGITYKGLDPNRTNVLITTCPSASDMTAKVNTIMANRELFANMFSAIEVTDALGDFIAKHELTVRQSVKKEGIINEHTDANIVVYAYHCGRLIKSYVNSTDKALAVANNFTHLGWDVEIDNVDDWTVLFNSDYDFIEQADDGTLNALHIVEAI